MGKNMELTIATPEGLLFTGKVESVKFPGMEGEFMVLPKHAPLISALVAGKVVYVQNGERFEQPIQSGFVEVNKDILSVCVEL